MASIFRHYISAVAYPTNEYNTITQQKHEAKSSSAAIVKSAAASFKPVLLTLPPPFNKNRRDNKLLFLLASCILSLLVVRNIVLYSNHIIHPFRNPNIEDFRLAYEESNGFFTDIPSHVWKQKKQRVQNQPKHNDEQLGLRSKFMNRNKPKSWYQHNWDAEFTCPHERRVGGVSDGAKWICDPHRLDKNRVNDEGIRDNANEAPRNDCLVYSFGRGSPITRSFDFAFEVDLLKTIGGEGSCKIHFFDHRLDSFGGHTPDGVILHPWGLEGSIDASKSRRNFMTLKETVQQLDHEGRELDIMRVDCEGCEWSTFREWLNSGVTPKQIVVSLHGAPGNEHNIFELMEANNYVIFHREADVRYGGMWQEYGFLKLAPEFFDRN